jgi:hypothetical protein
VIAFEWNSLRVRHRVIVHEHHADRYQLPQPGLVAFVTVRRPTNQVGIRIEPPSGSRVLWPTRQEVHAPTPRAAEACPHCTPVGDESAATPPTATRARP